MAMKKEQTSTMFLKMFPSIILLLGLCLSTKADKFDEAECRPRPTVVPISEEHKYRPYHILLYRCSGTYNKVSPSIKSCAVKVQHQVHVDVLDEHGNEVLLNVTNHTACGAECALPSSSCGDKMIMDDCMCKCLNQQDCPMQGQGTQTPSSGQQTGQEPNTSLPLPYMVGMAIVGVFAVFVLVFDAMLCVRKKGFMHTIKYNCCGQQAPLTDRNENQQYENEKMVQNEKETTEQPEDKQTSV